jgi:hypothetical protein
MPRLRDLEPKLANGYLRFTCPLPDCPLGAGHGIRVAVEKHDGVEEPVWEMSGEFPDTLTLKPSINEWSDYPDGRRQGWHGWITNGEVQ